jgi:catechol 2,3-dioxygenase-like lactoylglutathione lyase family enzyme
MLEEATVVATVAVKDLEQGKQFYGGTLGLHTNEEKPDGVTYQSGDGKLFVYQSSTAGSGQATCASWKVADVASIVEALKGKGVTFEHYDLPGAALDGDIHVMGEMQAAWFKDPDGNILCVANG